MDKSHEQGQTTRQRNLERKAAADAQTAEYRAQVMSMLSSVATAEDATTEQKLEAARLAVQLQKPY